MKYLCSTVLLISALASAGCYHATVTTGRTPSNVVIDKPFATGWIYGLVPPSTVNAASECPDGVAIVETELSFVNQLVSFITFGIFTPMHIKVTCAASGSASIDESNYVVTIPEGANESDVIEAFGIAADQAVASGGELHVRYQRVQP